MTRAERLALLGPEVIAYIHAEVDAAPPPDADLIAVLRRILTNPAGEPETGVAAPPAAA